MHYDYHSDDSSFKLESNFNFKRDVSQIFRVVFKAYEREFDYIYQKEYILHIEELSKFEKILK